MTLFSTPDKFLTNVQHTPHNTFLPHGFGTSRALSTKVQISFCIIPQPNISQRDNTTLQPSLHLRCRREQFLYRIHRHQVYHNHVVEEKHCRFAMILSTNQSIHHHRKSITFSSQRTSFPKISHLGSRDSYEEAFSFGILGNECYKSLRRPGAQV